MLPDSGLGVDSMLIDFLKFSTASSSNLLELLSWKTLLYSVNESLSVHRFIAKSGTLRSGLERVWINRGIKNFHFNFFSLEILRLCAHLINWNIVSLLKCLSLHGQSSHRSVPQIIHFIKAEAISISPSSYEFS
jgi:hypothetical protein